MKTLTISQNDFASMLVSHVRYCLTRTSYIYDDAIEQVKIYWDDIPQYARETILNDVQERVERFDRLNDSEPLEPESHYEHQINEVWRAFILWLEEMTITQEPSVEE